MYYDHGTYLHTVPTGSGQFSYSDVLRVSITPFCGSHSFPLFTGHRTAFSCGSNLALWKPGWGGLTQPLRNQTQGARESLAETGGSSQRGPQEGLNGLGETQLMKMASIQFDEVSSRERPNDTCKRKHLLVSKGRQEVSGTSVALIGQANTPRKRHTWLNLAQRNNKKPLSIVL